MDCAPISTSRCSSSSRPGSIWADASNGANARTSRSTISSITWLAIRRTSTRYGTTRPIPIIPVRQPTTAIRSLRSMPLGGVRRSLGCCRVISSSSSDSTSSPKDSICARPSRSIHIRRAAIRRPVTMPVTTTECVPLPTKIRRYRPAVTVRTAWRTGSRGISRWAMTASSAGMPSMPRSISTSRLTTATVFSPISTTT